MKKLILTKKSRNALLAVALASTGLLTGQKVYEYSADPAGEKECPPLLQQPSATTSGLLEPSRTVVAGPATLPLARTGGTLNDASCLNQTPVYGVVQVTSIEDIERTLTFARVNKLKVSIAGVRHSMGGQAFFRNAVVLDMTRFNAMSLDRAKRVLTVQSGATWHDIQTFLHPTYAVKAMQSTDIFSVGGSISVNAHGMDHQVGALGKTIRSMRLMLPDGSVKRVSRTEDQELFKLVIGGYGLFGIVLDVELDITDNVIYATDRKIIDFKAFPKLFADELGPDTRLGLMYAHLSTGPQSLLNEMILYTYTQTDGADVEVEPLTEVANTRLRRFVINFSKRGSVPMRLKWWVEKHVEPRFEACLVNRNQAMKDGEACLVSRNEPMHDSVKYLKNRLKNETDILQEYFIPRDQFVPFVDQLRQIVTENDVNLLNASVRVVHQEDNFLNYAPTDMFAVVLYINQDTTEAGHRKMSSVTRQITDLTLSHGGRFFLPYQLHYTPEQLQAAYPEIAAFFAAKRRYDPQLLLTNTFYEKYAPSVADQ